MARTQACLDRIRCRRTQGGHFLWRDSRRTLWRGKSRVRVPDLSPVCMCVCSLGYANAFERMDLHCVCCCRLTPPSVQTSSVRTRGTRRCALLMGRVPLYRQVACPPSWSSSSSTRLRTLSPHCWPHRSTRWTSRSPRGTASASNSRETRDVEITNSLHVRDTSVEKLTVCREDP